MQSDDLQTGDYSHDQVDIVHHMPFLEQCAAGAGIILEIGCGHGNGSTRAFARGLEWSTHRHKLHIIVDHDPDRPQVKPTYDYYAIVHGPSESPETARMVRDMMLGTPDIIFIDTDHTYEQMKKELEVWSPFAGPDTLWIFHDTWMFGEYNHMTDAIKEFAAENGWVFVDFSPASHGLGLMRKVKHAQA